MLKKQSSDSVSSLASDVLAGREQPTKREINSLPAFVLGQDEKRGKRPTPTKR